MNAFLILRLRNLAIAADQAGDGNVAALITEAIDELEKRDGSEPQVQDIQRRRYRLGDET